ncbi:MAG: hypothetical protein MZV49_14200 [Rhodopseudomonas palustris]|nr:hypothetical protein [Rhodopseudomonas palustris]
MGRHQRPGLRPERPEAGVLRRDGFIAGLNKDGYIDPDWTTLKKDEFRARWKQGEYGIMQENFAALSTVANYPAFDKNFPEGSGCPPPRWDRRARTPRACSTWTRASTCSPSARSTRARATRSPGSWSGSPRTGTPWPCSGKRA